MYLAISGSYVPTLSDINFLQPPLKEIFCPIRFDNFLLQRSIQSFIVKGEKPRLKIDVKLGSTRRRITNRIHNRHRAPCLTCNFGCGRYGWLYKFVERSINVAMITRATKTFLAVILLSMFHVFFLITTLVLCNTHHTPVDSPISHVCSEM